MLAIFIGWFDYKNVWKSDRRWEPENFENIKNDPWDMLNNFGFHVYAQKSLFIAENCNAFFYSSIIPWVYSS